MIYKTVSIKTLIANIQNDFNFTTNDWIVKAFDWIPRAMSIIGTTTPLEKKSKKVSVVAHRASLPCDLEFLLFITYNDTWLPIKSNGVLLSKYKCNECAESTDYFAVVNPTYLQTSFENGDIVFHYYSIPLDKDGLPLIPDSPLYIEAIGWYVTYKLLLSGYVHKSIRGYQDAYAMWEREWPRAKNELNFPSIDDVEQFSANWNDLVRNTSIINRLIHH